MAFPTRAGKGREGFKTVYPQNIESAAITHIGTNAFGVEKIPITIRGTAGGF